MIHSSCDARTSLSRWVHTNKWDVENGPSALKHLPTDSPCSSLGLLQGEKPCSPHLPLRITRSLKEKLVPAPRNENTVGYWTGQHGNTELPHLSSQRFAQLQCSQIWGNSLPLKNLKRSATSKGKTNNGWEIYSHSFFIFWSLKIVMGALISPEKVTSHFSC